MADHNKGGFISKAQKKLTRTKTKVLQNLGKAEKTSDERFDEHVHKLERQQEVAHRFQKELRNYIHCAKAMEVASKSFFAVILETYEQDWKDEAHLRETLQSLELMWGDFLQHLQESVQDPLNTYISHFNPLKQKIAKRHRKLDYFDNARHNAEVQQNAKKKDEAKISKANEELEESKRIYEVLNNELHNELPEFYNSRINFYASTFKNYFNAECTFHGESGKLNETAMSITDSLAEDHKQYTYQPRPLSSVLSNEDTVVNGHNSSEETDSKHSTPTAKKRDKTQTSPKPDRPPSSPAQSGSKGPTPIKTNGPELENGLHSDGESPPESPQTQEISKSEGPDKIEETKDSPKTEKAPKSEEIPKSEEVPKIEEASKTEEAPKTNVASTIKTDDAITIKTEEASKHKEASTNKETLKNEEASKIQEDPQTDKTPKTKEASDNEGTPQNKGASQNMEGQRKGPLYENSDVNYPTPSQVEETTTEKVNGHEETVTKSEESVQVKSEPPVTDNADKSPKEEGDAVPSYPPPQPPEVPKEPPPEDDIPVKQITDNIEDDDDADHYYDRVPDQLGDKHSDNEDDDLYEIPSSSKIPDVLPEGCQYVVVATHVYKNEDEDEISFEAGELIYVVPYDDPDDQDDGWLLGIKKSDGKKGVFPENFTKRLSEH